MKRLPLLMLTAATGVLAFGAARPQPAAPSPAGTYQLVALRAAPGVAHPLREAGSGPKIGGKVKLGGRGPWIDGQPCAGDLNPSKQPWAGLGDPMLSDLQLTAAGADLRLNRVWTLDCGGRARSSIISLLQIDRQVVVASINNGETLAVLERPITRKLGRDVEAALTRAGLRPGPVDGVLDQTARRAIAEYAKSRGAVFTFDAGVLTENLMTALLASSPPSR